MIGKVLIPRNLTLARNKVIANKGSCGVDGMKVEELTADAIVLAKKLWFSFGIDSRQVIPHSS